MLSIGTVVENIYTGEEGIIVGRALTSEMQDCYVVRWNFSRESIVPREELLV